MTLFKAQGCCNTTIEEIVRTIGNNGLNVGVFGWHDALIKLGYKYGDQDSLDIAEQIASWLKDTALLTSCELTGKYGCYPKYNKNAVLASEYLKENTDEVVLRHIEEYGLANSQILTVPPTGSIATMLGVSTALEPIYNISYQRKTESLHGKDEYYEVFTPIVDQYMKTNGLTKKEQLPNFFVTAMTLDWKDRINMQSIWQKYIDASISSTVNLPESATIQEVFDLYVYAWQKGLKGVTVFRDNCKRIGILTNTTEEKKDVIIKKEYEVVKQEELPRGYIMTVPSDLTYRKYKLKTGCSSIYLFVGVDDDGTIIDLFTNTDGQSGCPINTQAVSRLISLVLRGGIPIEKLIEQLNKSGTCPSYSFHRGKGAKLSKGKSCASSIANVLQDIINEPQNEEEAEEIKTEIVKYPCPECGSELHFEGGCNSCKNCGWSKCN